jgi:putative chitinase
MIVTASIIRHVAPQCGANAAAVAVALQPALDRFGITTRRRLAHFLAQVAHESGGFVRKRESLNYTPAAILSTFNTRAIQRFTLAQAEQLGRTSAHAADQQAIANIAYANRMENRGPESCDGWRTRGAGWIQLTGTTNHHACADFFSIPRDTIGAWLATDAGAALSAGWFWQLNNLNRFADVDDIDGVSDCVNMGRKTERIGDAIGYQERRFLTIEALKVIP